MNYSVAADVNTNLHTARSPLQTTNPKTETLNKEETLKDGMAKAGQSRSKVKAGQPQSKSSNTTSFKRSYQCVHFVYNLIIN